MSKYYVFAFRCTLEEVAKVKRIIRETSGFSTDTLTGLMLCTPNQLVDRGYLSIVIDEKNKDAAKAIAWANNLTIEVPAEDNPEELIENVIKKAIQKNEYNLFASITPYLETGLKLLEAGIKAKTAREN